MYGNEAKFASFGDLESRFSDLKSLSASYFTEANFVF